MCKEWKQDVDEARAEGMAKGHESGVAEGLAKGHASGVAEGLAKGHANGFAEGKLETAKAMLKDGLPAEKIALYTGLSASEIADLTVQ